MLPVYLDLDHFNLIVEIILILLKLERGKCNSESHLNDQTLNSCLNEQVADVEMVDASPATNGKTVFTLCLRASSIDFENYPYCHTEPPLNSCSQRHLLPLKLVARRPSLWATFLTLLKELTCKSHGLVSLLVGLCYQYSLYN